jgi:hypothetical protein
MMNWRVKKIQEDDYGCEERPENKKAKVLVSDQADQKQVRGLIKLIKTK